MTLSVDQTFDAMSKKFAAFAPEAELYLKAELVVAIDKLKQERNAVILGHNYMEPALFHTVCDLKGDSLELARKSMQTDAETLVFCGVGFMAETAKILNPSKRVLIPSLKAGCSLASSITAQDVRSLKAKYPGVPVVTYVNTFADVKAETDICCTSSNAVKIVNSLPTDSVIFLPDAYLAANVARQTNKTLITLQNTNEDSTGAHKDLHNTMIAWGGKCEVHEKFTPADITEVRTQFPDTVILAHPECPPEVCAAADFSGSTSAMIQYVQEQQAPRYMLLTECSMADNIIAENPDKTLLRMCSHRCPHMAQITLEMTRDALAHLQYEVTIPEDIRVRAQRALDRMLEVS